MTDHEEDDGATADSPFGDLLETISEETPTGDSDPPPATTKTASPDSSNTELTSFEDILSHVEGRRGEGNNDPAGGAFQLTDVNPGDAVLLIGNLDSEEGLDHCIHAFDRTQSAGRRVLLVSLSRKGRTRVRRVEETYGSSIEDLVHVHTGEWDDATIRSVSLSDPNDLTQLGLKISTVLNEWTEEDGAIDVCFHSLTALLQNTDKQRAFRFLHILIGRIEKFGVVLHVHMDADSHNAETTALFEQLFDRTIRLHD